MNLDELHEVVVSGRFPALAGLDASARAVDLVMNHDGGISTELPIVRIDWEPSAFISRTTSTAS